MEEQISKVFIHRRYKYDEILKDFCNDPDINLNYKKIKDLEDYLLFINGLKIQPFGQRLSLNRNYKEFYGIGINDFKSTRNQTIVKKLYEELLYKKPLLIKFNLSF